jgi:hypothetical protein
MPSRKKRRRQIEIYDEPVGDSPSESIFSILAEGLAAGIVKTFTAEAQKVAEAFVARQQGSAAPKEESPLVVVEDSETKPVVDNATTEKPDDSNVIEGEYKYVD